MTTHRDPRVKPVLATTAAVAILALLAACGGGGSTASPSKTTSTPRSSGTPSSVSQSPTVSKVAPVPVESNPPGDIPDNLAFVRYTNAAGHYTFTHPEGWARTVNGVQVRFTDKLNGVTVESAPAPAARTVASAKANDVPRLRQSVPAFQLRNVTEVSVPGGTGVQIVFRRNSDPDPVTGKVFRDEVEEYLLYKNGRLVRMDLYGPVGADNVDAYRTMSGSLRIR
ncbi:MAG: hypothetical protein ABJA93_00660 [Sporichthyaceae bacterium]